MLRRGVFVFNRPGGNHSLGLNVELELFTGQKSA